MPVPEIEVLNNLVSRVFRIEDVTSGDPARGTIARYRGQLIFEDSAAAYDELDALVSPYNITPLFRAENDQHVIYLTPKRPDPKPARISINIILFILTVFSVMLAGAQPEGPVPSTITGELLAMFKSIFTGWPYAVSLMSILLAHEFGHYLMSRHHKTPATLPYFIPFPLPPLGTMGAAILMQGTPKNKRVLFDIGVAGPLAGMVVAIPVLFYGLSLSKLGSVTPVQGIVSLEGNSILYLLAKYIAFGKLLPAPTSFCSATPIMYWIRYFFTATPIPVGGTDVLVNPIAFAGWAGLLVTALNLIPAGTLDGGHVVYALFGNKAAKAFPVIMIAVLALSLVWGGWWIWALLLFWLGRVHAEPYDQITTLDSKRRIVAAIVILIFVLTFMPVPFSGAAGL